VVELDPFEEGGVVLEVPILLRVGTFGDCKEGGSLRNHVVICKESLRGSGKIAKSRGICLGKEEWRRGRSVELVMWWSRERLSATWFSLPGNHFEKRTEEWSSRSLAVAQATQRRSGREPGWLSSKLEWWSQPAAVVLSVPVRMTELGGRPVIITSKASWT
jgi:hypothetical protein